MADDRIVYRTNAFSVTDEEAWQELFCQLSDKDKVTEHITNGFHTLECREGIRASFDEEAYIVPDFSEWTGRLQAILPKRGAFMLVTSYFEDGEHTGDCVIVMTQSEVRMDDLPDEIYLQAVGLKDISLAAQDKTLIPDIREELQNTLPEWEECIWRCTQEECNERLLQMQQHEISITTAQLLSEYMRRAKRSY